MIPHNILALKLFEEKYYLRKYETQFLYIFVLLLSLALSPILSGLGYDMCGTPSTIKAQRENELLLTFFFGFETI